jgi:hypothetical protein
MSMSNLYDENISCFLSNIIDVNLFYTMIDQEKLFYDLYFNKEPGRHKIDSLGDAIKLKISPEY